MSMHPQFCNRRTSSLLLLALVLSFAVVAGLAFAPRPVGASSEKDAAAAQRTAYSEKTAATYSDRFAPGSHFLPSLMTTDTGQFIDPKSFPTAEYCGHCHKESEHEWRQSAHSNSNRPPWYLANTNLLRDSKGVEFTRHCEGCHDPIALAAGELTPKSTTTRHHFDDDGITCSVCHSIQKTTTYGTGSYVLGVPAVLLDEQGQPITRPVSDAEILAHLDRHSAAEMKPFYKTSEYCAACHKAALPKELNDYKWQRAISLYDEWQNSSFAKESPLPFYKKATISTCNTCHMQREPLKLPDPGAKAGLLASHRWLGANTVIPQYYHFDEQAKKVVQYLQASALNVDLFAIEHGDPESGSPVTVSAPLGATTFDVVAGEPLTADVVIQNKGIGHTLVPEQRDMYQSWVDFTITDGAGKKLLESGFLNPDGSLDQRAHSFTNRLISPQGTLNRDHEVWNTRIVAFNNTIQSGRSQVVRYSFHMPAAALGPVTLTAIVRYRRFDQHFMDFGLHMPAGKHYSQQIVDMVSTSRTLKVGQNVPTPALKDENPVWMRWNNYGISLLDAQQYAAADAAFAQVAKLRPDYADAPINQAIVELQWQRYPEAMVDLEHALKLQPGDPRALYYRALVERNEGDLDKAINDLHQVIAAFPRSRDAHRELGFSLYQEHHYDLARAEYESVQTIDPDDLAAHYILAILYRRLGLKDKARQQSALFADQKDDPSANVSALDYLRQHTEIANESVVWHTHDLDSAASRLPRTLPQSFSATQN